MSKNPVFCDKLIKGNFWRNNENDAKKKLLEISKEAVPLPGSKGFFMGGQVKESKDSAEIGDFHEFHEFIAFFAFFPFF